MLAAFLADENARKRRRDEPVGIAPSPPKEPQARQPNEETSNTDTEDTQEVPSSRRPRRYTPYGPLPIRPGETVAEQIDAIQQQHHEIASHAYFLTDKALRGTATDVVDPVGIWGFEGSMVERFPSLKKRNFFCIQHHQATGGYAVLLHSDMFTLVFGRLPINVDIQQRYIMICVCSYAAGRTLGRSQRGLWGCIELMNRITRLYRHLSIPFRELVAHPETIFRDDGVDRC